MQPTGVNTPNIQTAHIIQSELDRRPKQTFCQRRHTDAQKAHEKSSTSLVIRGHTNQNHTEVLPHDWSSSKCLQIINATEGMEKENPCTLWWECILVWIL